MSDLAEKLIAASEPAAWGRYEPLLPMTYRTVTRRAHKAGFEAGMEFARIAINAMHGFPGSSAAEEHADWSCDHGCTAPSAICLLDHANREEDSTELLADGCPSCETSRIPGSGDPS